MSSEFTLCPACGKMFEEPVTLACFHTYCFQCVSKPNEKYVCSICNFEQNGSGVNTDSFTQTFCDVIRTERKLKDACFGCAENCAANYCFNCQDITRKVSATRMKSYRLRLFLNMASKRENLSRLFASSMVWASLSFAWRARDLRVVIAWFRNTRVIGVYPVKKL